MLGRQGVGASQLVTARLATTRHDTTRERSRRRRAAPARRTAMPPSAVPFSRRPSDGPRGARPILVVILIAAAATLLALAYSSFPSASRATTASSSMAVAPTDDGCCRGLEGRELWGPAVKWGSDHRLLSAAACCESCKAMCKANDCRCDSWVFCGDKKRCGQRFGEVRSPTHPLTIHSPFLLE